MDGSNSRTILSRALIGLGFLGSSAAGASGAVLFLGPERIECAPAGPLAFVAPAPVAEDWQPVYGSDEPGGAVSYSVPEPAHVSERRPVAAASLEELVFPEPGAIVPVSSVPPALAAPVPEPPAPVPMATMPRQMEQDVHTGAREERRMTVHSDPVGPLGAAEIRGVVHRSMPGLRRCYERATRRSGMATEESLTLELRVAGGTVRRAEVSGASSNVLAQCVESTARQWSFPTGYAEVSVPVRLRPAIN